MAQDIRAELEDLTTDGLRRTLRRVCGRQGPSMQVDGREVLLFAGANYLGLAGDPRLVRASCEAAEQYGCAAGGARLISGNLLLHEMLEREIASFVGTQAALLFSSGYLANLGLITALAGSDDVILSDALNHASIIDACRLSPAETRTFRHNDTDDLRRIAKTLSGFRRRILVVDGVFSMEGDTARLAEMVPLARDYDLSIVVDDAHGFGVLGPNGRGTPESQSVDVEIQIGNLGKALGSFGAFVACSHELREYLINRSRQFIFTCGLPPSVLGAARAALSILAAESERRERLMRLANQLRHGLQAAGYDTGHSNTHIVPAIVGANDATMTLCECALERGIYVQGIRFPSVPRGTERLRFSPMCDHTPADVDRAIRTLAELRR